MYKVLIVDDEPIVKIALRSIIPWEDYGYEICSTASNGQEALEIALECQPDIIITDLVMPVMNGIKFIEALNENNFSGEVIVISNHEDFQYVRSALTMGVLDYILKISINSEELLRQLNRASKNLSERDANAISEHSSSLNVAKHNYQIALRDYVTNSDSLPLGAYSELKDDIFPAFFCYIAFNERDNQGAPLSSALIENAFLEYLPKFSLDSYTFLNRHSVLLLVPNEKLESNGFMMKSWLLNLSRHFELCMSTSPDVIYAEDIKDYSHCKHYYLRSLDIRQLSFYSPLSLINANEYRTAHYLSCMYYKDLAKLIFENKLSGIDKSMETIDSIIENCKIIRTLPEIVRMYFIKTIRFLHFISENDRDDIHDSLIDASEEIRICSTSEEMRCHIYNSIKIILRHQDSLIGGQHKPEIKCALNYISENYINKITLKMLSSHVNLSTNYFCRLFKDEMGTSATDYINRFRMDKAKELMENEHMPMKEIAVKVGISDQLYFSRLFKKYHDITPSQYKKSLSQIH